MHRLIAALVVLVTAVSPAAAEETEADRLFEEGRQLLAAGRAAEACPKFERSQELDPGRGTLINIAACYEALDHLVEALAVFEDVAAQSAAAVPKDKDRLDAANQRIASLKSRIPHLAITAPAEVAITVAGQAVPAEAWGDVPVNPGDVEVTATRDGYEPWRTTVTAAEGAGTIAIDVPELAAGGSDGEHPAPPLRTRKNRVRTIAGLSIAGVGGVLFGTSIVLAVGAKGAYDEAIDMHCNGNPDACTQTGLDETADARKRGNVATVVGGIGLIALASGIVLWLTAPEETVEDRRATLVPQVTADGAGVVLVGSF